MVNILYRPMCFSFGEKTHFVRLLRVGSKKEGKQYRGVREGGISDNTTYYVFTHAKVKVNVVDLKNFIYSTMKIFTSQDGSFEAHPVTEWYNFTPRVTYNTLNAEEAEERFAERGKILNHFAIMVGKKLKQSQVFHIDISPFFLLLFNN